jgi:hypothetical protein
MFCPNCGTSIEDPGKFCPSCGQALPQLSPHQPEQAEVAAVAAVPSWAQTPLPTPEPGPPAEPEIGPAAEPEPGPATEPEIAAAAAPAPPAWAQTLPPAPAPEVVVPVAPVWAQPIPSAPAAPAPGWAQNMPPQAPLAAGAPPWAQAPAAQPPYGAAPYGPPPAATAPYGAPSAPYGAPPYGAPPPYPALAVAAGGSGRNPTAGLLALIGGAVAIGSALLPWYSVSSDALQTAAWARPIDLTKDLILANGYFLIGSAVLAALCGLLMMFGVARSPGARTLLGLGAITGAAGIGAVEFSAYSTVADLIKAFGSDNIFYGFGLFVGAGAAAVAGIGGVVALTSKPAAAGSTPASTRGLARVVALVLIVAVALGAGAYLLSQNNKAVGPGASGSLAFGATEQPSTSPGGSASATPGASQSFLTSGYDTREGAIGAYVEQHSVTYAGDCGSPGTGDYCSTLDSAVSDSQVVYTVGPINSEAVAWLLLQQTDDGLWHVLDQKPFNSSSTSPWQ